MSDLIDGNKLLAKIRRRMTDTNDVIDYFDVAHFELSWIEKWILKEMKANGDETSYKPALHKHIVSNSVVCKINMQPKNCYYRDITMECKGCRNNANNCC